MIKKYMILLPLLCSLLGCTKSDDALFPTPPKQFNSTVFIETDKACYTPNESVQFTLDKTLEGEIRVKYFHLGTLLKEEALPTKEWSWLPPSTDFKGYMVAVYEVVDGKEVLLGNIAVDVSSDWTKYPRYGFLSTYNTMTAETMDAVISNLSRFHLNGLQYQDCQYKHHKPLAGTVTDPALSWKDIANREVSKSTVDSYLLKARKKGMKSIFYDLCYGALSDAKADGVSEEWYLYKDRLHQQKDLHNLPSDYFWSDIYLVNPANVEWQAYLSQQVDAFYQVYNFDGFQIDQLGNRGQLYDYQGNAVDIKSGYTSFITAMKKAQPTKNLIMNAVAGYGQEEIAKGAVGFFYNEVWGDTPKFTDLAEIIATNKSYRADLSTVFAAYMNYDLANNSGYFNTPGVLLTDAVIFALGASHLELGEHMLGKEYFPNDNLKMDATLKNSLIAYYDFLVAYQNLLREGGSVDHSTVSCRNNKMSLSPWPPKTGDVAYLAKRVENRLVLQFLNFSEASNFDWRDLNGTQPEPTVVQEASLKITTTQPVSRVWMASPDYHKGVAEELDFVQNASGITLLYPKMKYWGMVVVEYK